MSRRGGIQKREVIPDARYRDKLVARLISYMMLDGKKSVAEGIVYGAFDVIKERTREEPLKIFHKALENCQPMVEVKSRRVGGANYQVPVEVSGSRKMALSMRWLIQYARQRSGRSMKEKLANELIEAAHQRGSAVKKRDDVHRMAEANKAFSHYRW